jgi:hypothetical protein
MSRRKRNGWIVLATVVAALAALEVGLTLWRGSEGCVEVHNAGAEPIVGLSLTYGTSRVVVPRVAPGGMARVFLGGRGARTLVMRFNQKGNALGAFEQPGFDPDQLSREGFKQVFRVRPNEVERYQDDSDPSTPLGQLLRAFWKHVSDALDPEKLSQ